MNYSVEDLVVPDPFTDKGILFVYPSVMPYQSCHPRHPDTLNIAVKYGHYKNDEQLESGVVNLNATKLDTKSWDNFIEVINLCVNNTGPSTSIVSIHNIGLLQRATWWWSRRMTMPDPLWNNSRVNIDIVNLYNGPAILTAEERFSFNINMACMSLGKEITDMPGDIEQQYKNFIWLWNKLRV
tara:strand:+ start:1832 stop:2380 length:549 start_codon:yes stop_codon:yes gene_type:complete